MTAQRSIREALSPSRPALAILIARAGSKGLPGKNAMPIAGKPCAQWTLEHASAAKRVGAVVLSTDDASLQSLARTLGVHVVERPADLADDTVTVDAAVRHAVQTIEGGTPLAWTTPIVILYANVPVRPAGLIDRAIERLLETECDSVQSYAQVGKTHPWWMVRIAPDASGPEAGLVRPWEGEVLNHGVFRRQDLPPAFLPDGGVLVVTRAALFHEVAGVQPGPHAFFGRDRRGVITREGDVIDIDSRIDALVAESILKDTHAHR